MKMLRRTRGIMAPFGRACVALSLCILLALTPHAASAAQAPDVAALNPPPFGGNLICQATGMGTICRSDDTFSETNADTGISCGSFEILSTDTFSADHTFTYDQANNLTTYVAHRSDPGSWINSLTGKNMPVTEHDTLTLSFGIPGDLGTASARYDGQVTTATASGSGLAFHDVGTVTFDPSGNVLREGGPHDVLNNFPGVIQAACAALA